ncbi:18520_t:CDS:10 [Entrophospora sp. SA101]|nr:5317_t:CDS:10 [Entrophospora sp. SA101]CAJ0651039.1 10115_t:CDS:10 [Entrophospora sp. SA101]CAJ0747379.1 10702_t:CDS:10 [Entrophospora sp. SA101]CAJ0757852.1 18520_t:CDS:10 [Entrophospora sp. SA101]CAJ0829548.1 3012_t:CDS:10 [Entrophospora sp. SA101]
MTSVTLVNFKSSESNEDSDDNPFLPRLSFSAGLLSFVILFGLYRYLAVIRTRQHNYSLQNKPFITKFVNILSAFVIVSYLLDCMLVIIRALESKVWTKRQKFGKLSWVNLTFYLFSNITETLIFVYWYLQFKHSKPENGYSIYDKAFFILFIARYLAIFITSILSLIEVFSKPVDLDVENGSNRSLLENSNSYGTFPSNENEPQATNQSSSGQGAFSDFFSKMKKLLPFLWPSKQPFLQFLIYICFTLLVVGRLINVLVPEQLELITDILSGDNGQKPRFPWEAIIIFVFLRFLQGGVGLVQSTQNYLWIPIGQYTTREISVKMFEHLHGLSLSYHINRKTGEVLRVMDRGTNSIITLLNQILFQIFPVIVDIIVAVVYFVIRFGWVFGAIVFITMTAYIFLTIWITEWRTKFRREMIELDNDTRAKAVDSLLNFETVKYYNAEQFEIRRYDESIKKFQVADYKVASSLNILNLGQNFVITLGLLAGCLICAKNVASGDYTVGKFILFVTYINQLYTPLNFFGTYYRLIQQNFIDMEKMFLLFKEKQSVQDDPNASELNVTDGEIIFDNVGFSYDSRNESLKNISFTIPKGKTVALVGPSGGGKSTILRLLFRFYDVNSGQILIDGQDIKHVTQESLRKNIGVVPQDTVLFNDTIFYNIHYGNVNASDDEVYKAAKSSQIHDKILSFPDGYETRVGERGLRLSGGEKQRVAIARTILKIILLDEATSALDTTTERQIQFALSHMTKDRTTLVIAHRLSTIVNADLILCIKDGQVIEQGTHDELLKQALEKGGEGVYYEMWQKQLRDESEGTNQDSEEGNSKNAKEIEPPK